MKKEITFVYMDMAERNLYQPIAEEAQKRGYSVNFTDNRFAKCEIGFYCQHVNFPSNSKFSVIMLHDLTQQYSVWPDLWFREPWNIYDIGILPSKQWEENWNECSQWAYTRPRRGMFEIGWPKADIAANIKNSVSKEDFCKSYGINTSKPTILYAPAWENDHKQDDFVQAMLKLDVNILIKQHAFSELEFPQNVRNVKEMEELHKGIPQVTILPPQTNIFEAIAISDVLVSEESSTMCEATMMGIPAISVSNWLIPDCTPSRYPKCDYDFVTMTKKEELTQCVSNILTHYEAFHEKTLRYARENFGNVGNCSHIIMDIIDDCVDEKPIRYKSLCPKPLVKKPLRQDLERRFIVFRRRMQTIRKTNKLIDILLSLYSKLKIFNNEH